MLYELEEQEAIGRRVRRQRLRLGMAQADLARALGKSQGWLSKVESGRLELDRTSLINRIAAALHCHPNELIERPYCGSASEDGQWQASAAAILRELRRYDLPPVFDSTPRTSAELWQDTRRLHRLRDAAANVAILRTLPDLLREARALADAASAGPHEREERLPSTRSAASSPTPPLTPSDTRSWSPPPANAPPGPRSCPVTR